MAVGEERGGRLQLMAAALLAEGGKFARSTAAAVATGVFVVVAPAMMIWMVAASGALAGTVDETPLGVKVGALLTTTGGAALFELGAQLLSVATLIVVGVVLAWTVGREFVDGTVTSLFAQPVDRVAVMGAKVTVVSGWATACCLVVAAELLLVAVGCGAGLDGAGPLLGRMVVVSMLGVVLALPMAWVATITRSYLAAVAALMGLVALTQVVTTMGAGRWWPWAAPSLWAGMGGPEAQAAVGPGHLALAAPVVAASLIALARRWRRLELG